MTKGIHILLISLFFLITGVIKSHGQPTFFVGQEVSLGVDQVDENDYLWDVYLDQNASVLASQDSYDFISSKTSSDTKLVFNEIGNYFVIVFETNNSGCSTGRALKIEVLANNLTLSISNSTSNQCYQEADNSFAVALQFSDNDGNALTQDHFPVVVTYQINGVEQPTQSIDYFNQRLQISDNSFVVDPSQNTPVSVTLLSATDANSSTIQPQAGQNIHTHTIDAQPLVSFEELIDILFQDTEKLYDVNGDMAWTYSWFLIAPDGTELELSSTTTQSDVINFSQLGTYELYVHAFNVQGCISNTATKTIEVRDKGQGAENVEPLAVKDINLTWMNSAISGNLLTNDLFYKSDQYQLKLITIPLAEVGKLTSFNNKTGDYTFVPEEDYTGEAIFEYQVCKTNGSGITLCSDTSVVTIQVLDAMATNQAPVANEDAMVIPANTTTDGNFLQNDFDLESNAFSISQVVTTNLPGTFAWKVDGSYAYTPEIGFTGNVHFNYQICNELGNCEWSTVSIDVLSNDVFNDRTFAADDVYYSMSSGKITGDLSENDHLVEGSQYNYSLVTGIGPVNGSVTITNDGRFEYIPANGFDDPFSDQFIYEMCDVDDPTKCSRATVYLMDNPIAPLAVIEADTLNTGVCASIQLDAGNSEGRGDLSYSWTPSTYLDNPGISNPIFTPGVSTNYIVTVTDGYGVSSTDSVFVTVEPVEVVVDNRIFVNNAPDMIMLDASASIGRNLSFNWWSEGGELIVSGAQTATPEVSGLGKYYLQITDQYGCSAVDSVTVGLLVQVNAMNDTVGLLINTFADINVLENDVPSGELNPQSITIVSPPGHGFATVTSDSIITYTPTQYYIGQDAFIYAVCDYFDRCDEATVLVMISDETLFVPNAFSPNGDGVNDYFEIQGIAQYDQVDLKVFNRWGNLVYQSSNYGEGSNRSGFWDGIANKGIRIGNGEVPTGTYYYILDLGGDNQKITGFIYLDR